MTAGELNICEELLQALNDPNDPNDFADSVKTIVPMTLMVLQSSPDFPLNSSCVRFSQLYLQTFLNCPSKLCLKTCFSNCINNFTLDTQFMKFMFKSEYRDTMVAGAREGRGSKEPVFVRKYRFPAKKS